MLDRAPAAPATGADSGARVVVRSWGLGYVLLGISLAVESVTLMTGGEPGWLADVTRWIAGPLVVGSILAAFVFRRWERGRARAMSEGPQA
ncbi:hypothetical protein [Streptomyces sp. NPDC046685]|uniref:hypothetical protein n=1 Tax=Streptomyces sp. NPDC046685 TaxID=3157202 RepID=UPI0033F30EA0